MPITVITAIGSRIRLEAGFAAKVSVQWTFAILPIINFV